MSTTVDRRVVEMQFDNKHFESNVSTTMSSLDKLKQRLQLKDASKGLENVGTAAKNVNMSPLNGAVETVQAKFSALQVIGVTALSNITNSAVNAGKRLLSSLTIEPIKTGFNEYELKMDSVKTIMASTGESVETVNKYLEELNEYSDQTIYSFSDMTQNIGKFTNAGVKLEDAVMAIKGISNEAAVSGANANEASRAMYNFAQALSAGHVKLIDWKSIENANMATVEFKNHLLESAEAAGTLKKNADGMYETVNGKTLNATQNFNDTLKDEWMTTEVLVDTLKDYADANTEIGKKAFAAAQDVTKFTQMLDVLKETAQSGWAKTWEIIFGDIEQAKAIFTPLTSFFSGVIDKISDFRNGVLEIALGKGFGDLAKKLSSITSPIKNVTNAVKNITNSLVDLDDIVNRVIRGEFGNGVPRYDELTEQGINYYAVQNKVNEKLNNSFRYTQDVIDAQDKLLGTQKKTTSSTKEAAEAQVSFTEAEQDHLLSLIKLSDAQLRAKGYTEEQIAALRELERLSERLGIPLKELIANLDKINGRWLLINSFKNIGKGLVKIFSAIKDAFNDTFNISQEGLGNALFDVIVGLHKATAMFVDYITENSDEITRIFKGLFAIIDLIATVTGGAFRIAFKIISKVLSYFNMDVLDLIAYVGDAIVKFRDWIKETFDFSDAIDGISTIIKNAVVGIKDWIKGLKETDNIPKYIIEGLVNGLKNGISTVWNIALELGKTILESIKNFLGIHSPSTEMYTVGENVIQGLVNGISDGASTVWEVVKKVANGIINFIKNIDFGSVLAVALGAALLFLAKNLINMISLFAAPLDGLGEMFIGLGKAFKAASWNMKAKAIKNIAISIGILAAAAVLLTFVDQKKLWSAIGAIAALAAIIAVLMAIAGGLGKLGALDMGKMSLNLMGIAASILILAIAIKKLSSVPMESVPDLIAMVLILGGALLALSAVSRVAGNHAAKVGGMLLMIAAAFLVMTIVIKRISKLDPNDLFIGLGTIALLSVVFMALIAVSKLAGAHAAKAGAMLLLMSFAFLIMVSVIKKIAKMEPEALTKGLIGVTLLGLVFSALIAVTKLTGKDALKAGGSLILMAGAFLIMTSVIKILSKMDGVDLAKGLGIMVAIGAIFSGLIAVTKLAGQNAVKAGVMLLAMSAAMIILTGVLFIISKINPDGLTRALITVSVLGSIFAGLIFVTKFAQGCKDELMVMTIAIGLLAAAIIALSFIKKDKLAAATAALSSVIGMFALLITVTKFAKNSKSMRKSLFTMLGVVAGLAAIIAVLSFLEPGSIMTTTTALSILLLSLSASMAILGATGRISKTVTKNLLPMLGVVAGLAAILALLSTLKVEASLNNAIALAILLSAMAGALFVLSYSGKTSMSSIGALALMGLVVAELAAILGVMAYFNVEGSLKTVACISILLTAMTGVLIILGLLSPIISSSYAGIGAMALLGAVMAELVVVLAIMNQLNVAPSLETVQALSVLLVSMSAVLLLLGIVGAMGVVSFIGIVALAALIVAMGALLVGIGALVTYVPEVEEFLDKGIPILEKIGYGLGSFFGNIVSGFTDSIYESLPKLGTALSDFITNAQPFIEGVKTVDLSMLEGIGVLTSAILLLTAADLINSVTSFLTFGSSFADLGTELSDFIANAQPFIEAVGSVDPAAMDGAKTLAETILVLTGSKLLDQLANWLGADTSLASFGEDLAAFAPSLASFAEGVSGLTDKELGTMKIAAEAGKLLADMASSFPNSGGLLGKIMGENDADEFGEQLEGFGQSLMTYGETVTGIEEYVDDINASAEAGKGLTELAKSIPNSGGFLADFLGDNTMDEFGEQLEGFGQSLMTYGETVSGVQDYVEDIKASAGASEGLTALADKVPNSGGFIADFLGDNTIDEFGEQLKGYGQCLMDYGAVVSGGKGGKSISDYADSIKKSASVSEDLVDVAEAINGTSKKDLKTTKIANFGKAITLIGSAIVAYCDYVSDVDTTQMDKATNSIDDLVSVIEDITDLSFDGIAEFHDAFHILAELGVEGFVSTFENSDDEVESAVSDMLDAFVDSVEDNAFYAVSACRNMVKDAITAIRDKYNSIKDAGLYLVTGFAKGISENTWRAEAKARVMARDAATAAEEELDINSPSKVFRKIGYSVPEGFAQGIDRMSGIVTDSSVSMARLAVDGVRDSISRISDFINADIDTQPTIRPVLDLSDVKANAGSISEIFGSGPSVRVLSNVRSISSMMNRRGQNGRNDDVVSAIDKLNKNLGKVGNTTYNSIGGITYDDGSNISEAIRTIVRAVKVEGRT